MEWLLLQPAMAQRREKSEVLKARAAEGQIQLLRGAEDRIIWWAKSERRGAKGLWKT